MTEDLQPALHLSSDQLSAFAENVLPEHERLAALTHLAGCADCRQVVFLAQQAEPALIAPLPAGETPRRGWFTLPQIFGAATAALACSLILALIIHLRHTEIPSTASVTTAKIEQPSVSTLQPLTSSTAAAPAPSAQRASSPAHTSVTTFNGSDDYVIVQPPKPAQIQMAPDPRPQTLGAMGAGMPSTGFAESKQQDKANYGYSAPSASTYAVLPPKAPAAFADAMPAPPPPAPPPPAPPPPPPPPESRSREATNDSAQSKKDFSAAETVTVTAAAPSVNTTTEVAADTISMNSIQSLPLSGRAVVNQAAAKPAAPPIQLPSNKPVANVLHATGRSLALDTAGSLFLSLDRGKHWTAVRAQWQGKAIAIGFAATPARLHLQQPSQNQTQTQNNSSTNGSATTGGIPQQQAPIPAAGFDLTTATGAVWHSVDGTTWHQR